MSQKIDREDIFATHNTAPAFVILVVQNGDHDFGSGGNIDLGPFELVGILVTKVDAKPGFYQVSKQFKARCTGVTHRGSPHGLLEGTMMTL